MSSFFKQRILKEYLLTEDEIIAEAINDALLERYNAIIDKVDGLINTFSEMKLIGFSKVLEQVLENVRKEMTELSDEDSQKGLKGLVGAVNKISQSGTTLEILESWMSDIDEMFRKAYKYVSTYMTRNMKAGAVPFVELELDEKQQQNLKKLLTNSFKDAKSPYIRQHAEQIMDEVWNNLSIDQLKSLINQIDAISEVIDDEREEINSINKKISSEEESKVQGIDVDQSKINAAGAQLGVKPSSKAVADKVTKYLKNTKGKGDEVQVALNILSGLSKTELASVIKLIKRLTA